MDRVILREPQKEQPADAFEVFRKHYEQARVQDEYAVTQECLIRDHNERAIAAEEETRADTRPQPPQSAPSPARAKRLKSVRAKTEPLAIVAEMQSQGVDFSTTRAKRHEQARYDQYDNLTCPNCGLNSLSVKVQWNGGGAYKCHHCSLAKSESPEFLTDEERGFCGTVTPNRRRGRRPPEPHWCDKLPPEGKAWLARLLREHASVVDLQLVGDEEVVQTVKELAYNPPVYRDQKGKERRDTRWKTAWNATARAFRGV